MREDHYVLEHHKNGYWYYYVYRWGKRIRRTTGEKKKALALEVINDRIKRGDLLNEKKESRPKTFAEFAQPFWIYETCPIIQDRLKRGGHYTKAFCDTNRNQLNKYLIPAFGKKLLPEITQATLIFTKKQEESLFLFLIQWLKEMQKLYPQLMTKLD